MAITRPPYPPAPTDDLPINITLAVAGTAQDAVAVPAGQIGRSFSITNDGPGIAYIKADAVATILNGTPIMNGETYNQDGLALAARISFIGQSGKKPVLRGVLWVGT